MDEIVEREAVSEAVLEVPAAPEQSSDTPVAYVFDGWGMVPVEF